jgi:hypothetical protein
MNRRSFLKSSIRAGVTASIVGPVAAQTERPKANIPSDGKLLPEAMIGDSAMAAYFTDQRLHQALGTDELQKPTDVQVVAFNFPSWHPSKYMEDRFGNGWTEYDTLRNARTLFPGHSMPLGLLRRVRSCLGGKGDRSGRKLRSGWLADRLVLA